MEAATDRRDGIEQDNLLAQFCRELSVKNRPACVTLALQALETEKISLVDLYTQVLAPALNQLTEAGATSPTAVWDEHVRSGILRGVIECCYPYVIRLAEKKYAGEYKGKVLIASPKEELHELGARMGADFFALCGYEVIFCGANTPTADILAGISQETPVFVVINVVNFYHLVTFKGLYQEISQLAPRVQILASGAAFHLKSHNDLGLPQLRVIRSIEDIEALVP